MNRFALRYSAMLALMFAVVAGSSWALAETPQVAVAEKPNLTPRVDASKLRTEGLDNALAGHFDKGLTQLKAAAKADPADAVTAQAIKLIEEHMKVAEKSRAQRASEYNDAVMRVGHMNLAQKYVDSADKDLLKALRKSVRALGTSYNETALADALEDTKDPKEAAKLRTDSIDALGRALAALAEAVKVLEKDKSPYAKMFRETAKAGKELMEKHQAAWKAVDVTEAAAWQQASQDIREIEYDEADVLGDLESMSYEQPWRVGLIQARLAGRLAPDRAELVGAQWFKDLVSKTEARAKKCIKDAEWYDALRCYVALQELLPDDAGYIKMVKTVTRHVHVLAMYGGHEATTQMASTDDKKSSFSATKTAGDDAAGDEEDADSGEPNWQEVVANVDAHMVERIIGQLDLNYVSSVDYRKVTKGGLDSVKILAETPQAGDSFPGLKDDAKRNKFLAAIDKQIKDVDTRDRVTHLDLILALNSVLHASEDSVNIPVDVLSVEFADGFLDELDKFSTMIWPSDVLNFQKQTMGHFYGVGVQISKDPGEPLKVVTPLAGTPAYKAGIQAGDLITKVDGKATEKLSIDQLIKMIMGDKGTAVELTIRRGGGTEKNYKIVRDEIQIRTVKGWRNLPDTGEWDYLVDPASKIGYIRVTQFTDDTDERLAAALDKLKSEGVHSVIMDLRFNPGGLLRSAWAVSNEFLRSGRIVSTRGRNTRPTDLNARPNGEFLDGNLIVLANQYSASAAEIVSGALQDWKRAAIVGQRTYGKGSVQNVIPLSSQRALLKLTTAYYYLPKGRLLHRTPGAKDWGVDPDVEVFLSPRETRRWLDIRRKTDILQDGQQAQLTGDLARQYQADTQLSTAVLLLKLTQLREKAAA